MSKSKKGWNRRMSDNTDGMPEVPVMNGTIKQLTTMLAERIDTPEAQETVTKELITLHLNMYLLQLDTGIKLDKLLKERGSILNRFLDKLFLFLYTIGIVILYLVFQNFKP